MGEAAATPTADLVSRAREGDLEAFCELVRLNQDYIHNAVYHLVGREHDVEDITQEVFTRAFDGLEGFRGRAKFSTWLYSIMLNCVRSYWRRRGRGSVVSLHGADEDRGPRPDPPAEGTGPGEAALRAERVRQVRAGIARLEPQMREIVVLRDLQGLSYKELARTLQVAVGTVKSRLHRARLALRDELEPMFGGGPADRQE